MKIRNYLVTAFICLLVYIAMSVPIYGHSGATIVNSLIQVAMGTVFLSPYDTATPAGTDDPSEADDRMREIKAAVQERMDVAMFWPLTGTEVSDAHAGEVRKIPFHASIADPTQVASHSDLYMQSDELRYQDDTNSAFDLTSGGNLGSASTNLLANTATISSTLDVIGNIDPTTYETTNGGFLDEDAMGSNSATSTVSQQSLVAYIGGTLSGGAGSIGEVAIGDLELKWGFKNIAANTEVAIDFTDEGLSDFTTACFYVYPTYNSSLTTLSNPCAARLPTTTGFNLLNGENSTAQNINWLAIGR